MTRHLFNLFCFVSLMQTIIAQPLQKTVKTNLQAYQKSSVSLVKSNFYMSQTDMNTRSLEVQDTTYVFYLKDFTDKKTCTSSDSAMVDPWGGNFYQETAKGQLTLIDAKGKGYDSARINSVWAKLFAYKITNANASVRAEIYQFDTAQGIPTTLLGSSKPVLLTAIQSNPLQNFSFASPVLVPEDGFVMVAITTPQSDVDQTVLYSTPAGCSTNPVRAWESLKFNGTDYWFPITYTWSPDSGQLNGPSVHFHVFPEVSFYKSVNVQSSAKEFVTFSFDALTPPVQGLVWDTMVTLEVPFGTSLSGLVASFTVKDSAKVSVNGADQTSGQTANDFSSPLSYLLTAEDGSIKTYIVKVDVLASINDETLSGLKLDPNPVNNHLFVSFAQGQKDADIRVFNVAGKLVIEEKWNESNRQENRSLDFSTLKPGVYFVQISSEKGQLVKKIIKN